MVILRTVSWLALLNRVTWTFTCGHFMHGQLVGTVEQLYGFSLWSFYAAELEKNQRNYARPLGSPIRRRG